jgi:hypothetical protein
MQVHAVSLAAKRGGKMYRMRKYTLAGALLASASMTHASDKRDFEGCDGRIHPGKQDDGMRGEAGQSGYSLFPGAKRGTDIAACTRALASPRLLPTQNLRKAHLLRARAAAYLQEGETANAIADLDMADAAMASLADNVFYRRSMGVSLSLLRAVALAQSGKIEDAVPLARAAAQTRPYSLQILNGAAKILQASREAGDGTASPWLPAIPLEPAMAATAMSNEAELGNFAAVVSLSEGVEPEWPTKPLTSFGLGSDENSSNLVSALMVSLDSAYARAATGDVPGAQATLALMKEKMAPALSMPTDKEGTSFTTPIRDIMNKFVDIRQKQVDARIAVAEGRTNDALAMLVGAQLPRNAVTVELLTALGKALPEKDRAASPDVAPFMTELAAQRKKGLDAIIPTLLIAPETPRSVVDYDKARPNILGALIGGALTMGTSLLGGIKRTDGFRSTANADGTTKVEFIGNTPSAALVQEMTLLRAAELAKAAGKTHFIIVDRKDFSRYMQTTQYGVPISSVPTGFKTELTVRFVDATVDPARALNAVSVIDALGPLYYEDKKS